VVPTLETARLRLRALRPADFDGWCAVMADPVVARYLGGQPMSPEETVRRMLASAGCWMLRGYGYWAVTEKADDRMIGHVGLADFSRAITPSIAGQPEAGWILAPEAHGRGYASEAVAAALGWADAALPDPEFVAIIDPKNEPSIRVAEKAGFVRAERTTYRNEPILIFRRPRTAGKAEASA
jgi:RimJ/RimL family protein N-acetyltransferase